MKNIYKLFTIGIIIFSFGCVSHSQVITIPEHLNLPAPQNGTGVVFGVIQMSTGEPINGNLYLSKNITYNNPELPPTISFSYSKSPRANVDYESGYFYFNNVEPGENYVLTIITGPDEPFIVSEEDSEYPLYIIALSGEYTELGVISVNLP